MSQSAKSKQPKARKTPRAKHDQRDVQKYISSHLNPVPLRDTCVGGLRYQLVHDGRLLCTRTSIIYGVPFDHTVDGVIVNVTPVARSCNTVYCLVNKPGAENSNPDIAREDNVRRAREAFGKPMTVFLIEYDSHVLFPSMRHFPCVGDIVSSERGKRLELRAILSSQLDDDVCTLTCVFK